MRRFILFVILTLAVGLPTHAQAQQPTTQPPMASSAPTPAPPGQATTPPAMATGQQAPRAEAPSAPHIGTADNRSMGPVNIRLELSITDNMAGTPTKKSVSLLVLNGNSGMIRTLNYDPDQATFNVDGVANAYQNEAISVRLTFDYSPPSSRDSQGRTTRSPRLNESINVVLRNGMPLMVSQYADPGSDRKVTAELTATILK